jgi:hypothetical protein
MPTIRCFPDDVLTLTVDNRGSDGEHYPSLTTPTWVLSNHALVEFKEMSPNGHSVKVLAIAIGAPTVTATLDTGPVVFTLNIVTPTALTKAPFGDYLRHPPVRPLP